jgi:iron complex outermembrane receptor protein
MRGQVSVGVVPGSDKQVSIYLDGVYLASPRGSIFDLPDVARIEVLRGPQGTLFGRNATAGAVSVTTRDPTGDPHIRARFTYGNRDHTDAELSAELPRMGPFSAYFSFVRRYKHGDVKNANAGLVWDRTMSPSPFGKVARSPEYLGTVDSNSYFAAVKFEPSDAFNVVYKYDRNEDHGIPDAAATTGYDPNAPLTGNLMTALLTSQPFHVYTATDGLRPDYVNNGYTVPRDNLTQGHSVTATWQAMDNLTIKNVFAYRSAKVFGINPVDGLSSLVFTQQAVAPLATLYAFSSLPPAQAPAAIPAIAAGLQSQVGSRFVVIGTNSATQTKQWSDELQVNFHTGPLELTAGALWFQVKDNTGSPLGELSSYSLTILPANGVVPNSNGQGQFFINNTSLAAYLQLEYAITPALSVVAGGRITHDKKDSDFEFGPYTSPTSYRSPTYKKTKPNFMIGLNYKPNDATLIYAKYSTSFVSGGSTIGIPYAPETAKSFELGVKADMFDRHLRANLALYHVNYDHYQVAQGISQPASKALAIAALTSVFDAATANKLVTGFSTFVYDSGSLRSQGVELEVTAAPVRGVSMGGTLGFTDAKYTYVDPLVLLTNGGVFPLINRPKWTGTAWAMYETEPLFGNTTLMIRADTAYKSREGLDIGRPRPQPQLQTLATVQPYWLFNGRAALRHLSLGPIDAELAVWGKNLTDRRYPNFALVNALSAAANFIPARSYGMDLTIEF